MLLYIRSEDHGIDYIILSAQHKGKTGLPKLLEANGRILTIDIELEADIGLKHKPRLNKSWEWRLIN